MATDVKILETYNLKLINLTIRVDILTSDKYYVNYYVISLPNITAVTKTILNKIREEFLNRIEVAEHVKKKGIGEELSSDIQKKFKVEIAALVQKYFPGITKEKLDIFTTYLIQQNLGLGNIEFLLKDAELEEIVVNNSNEPVWVYHKKHGWLKTNIVVENEAMIRHYSTMIGRDVGKEITILKPLMDAHLKTGDRVNAILGPVATKGNAITIRKFAEKPWTIVDFIKNKTMTLDSASFAWLAIENELSTLISGGTGSGKTSTLNVLAAFFPPNQRIVSIEDTREIVLPDSLHWVPMETRLPNPEGKGEVSMLDLVINSLRMRPDRIVVGEIRRQREAEVLFEAMHTGHSVYATVHANTARETIRRLTNPPINIPQSVLPALSLIIVQNRNRRLGLRRTFQLAEIDEDGNENVFMQLNTTDDTLDNIKEPKRVYDTMTLYTGMTGKEIKSDLKRKSDILKMLINKNITDINLLGHVFAKYYKKPDISIKDLEKSIK